MDYKVLVKVYVPEIEQDFEMYVPINKTVSQVLILLNKLINNITNEVYPIKQYIRLYNRRTFQVYNMETAIRDTDIRNGSEIVIE